MMLTKGMTREEVETMMTACGWEYLEDATDCVWQGDHAVGICYDESGRVEELQYIPEWML